MMRPRLTAVEQVAAIAALLHPDADDLDAFVWPYASRLVAWPGLRVFDDGAPRQIVALLADWDTIVARDGWWAVFEARDAVWDTYVRASRHRLNDPAIRAALREPLPRYQLAQLVEWCAQAPRPVVADGHAVVRGLLGYVAPADRADIGYVLHGLVA
jgi:hypothetical protein